jgi:hypothetical protein
MDSRGASDPAIGWDIGGPGLRLRDVFPEMCSHGDVQGAAMTVRAMVAPIRSSAGVRPTTRSSTAWQRWRPGDVAVSEAGMDEHAFGQ